jgi:hypothetical protein
MSEWLVSGAAKLYLNYVCIAPFDGLRVAPIWTFFTFVVFPNRHFIASSGKP